MYSTHNEDNSVVSESFIKALKRKAYQKMAANNRKSYLCYSLKLVDEYNNNYHRSIGKKPVDGDYSAFTKEI